MATSVIGEPGAGVPDELLVYRLVDPQVTLEAAAAIEAALTAHCPLPPIAPEISMSAQGCVRFVDQGAMDWSRRPDALPPTDRAAASVAREFLKRANVAVAQGTRGRVPDLFQLQGLQHGTTRRQHSPATREPHHWLSTWSLQLPSRAFGRHELAPVIGGTVQVRIGDHGRVIGLLSAVRPIAGRLARPAFPFARADQGHDDEGEGHHGELSSWASPARPIVVYVAEGSHAPQRFLSPGYIDPTALDPEHASGPGHGHGHGSIWPACDHTLIAQIAVMQREDGASVRALLTGAGGVASPIDGQREYGVRWGVATQADFVEGVMRIEEGEALELAAPGLYHVELSVEHFATECIATTYVHVPVLGKADLPDRSRLSGRPARTSP